MSEETGLNLDAMASYRLADRFYCEICKRQPNLLKAEYSNGQVIVDLACHESRVTKSYSKSDLVFTQTVWREPAP